MSGIKVDILLSPNRGDQYVTFSSDLNLFKTEPAKEGTPRGTRISDNTCAKLLTTNNDHQYVKCISWYPYTSPDQLLALGLANGRVVLSSFEKSTASDTYSLIGKEFVPRYQRQCNCLAWSPVDNNLLAEGLDKYRADYSLLIWDVFSCPGEGFHKPSDSNVIKPLVELGPSESTLSLDWFTQQPKTLVTGMNNKFLRIFDLRDISRPRSVAYSKAVYGVCVDPHIKHRVASFTDSQVAIWDTRSFDRPVLTQQESKPILKIQWCPTRSGLLGVLQTDSTAVKVYDVQHATIGADEIEQTMMEHIIQTPGSHSISSFDWHKQDENRLFTVTASSVVRDVRMYERISVTWAADIHLMWACGRQLLHANSVQLCHEANDDISIKMKRRAMRGYGIQDQVCDNVQFVADDAQLVDLWRWIYHAKLLHGETNPKPNPRSPSWFIGVHDTILKENKRSDMEICNFQDLDGARRPTKKCYRSDERRRALKLCCWDPDRDQGAVTARVKRLEDEGSHERAAAIALFNLQFRRALQCLNKSKRKEQQRESDTNLSIVAMALSGFADDCNSLWKEMCRDLHDKLDNAYLRAMFAFLIAENNDYEEILEDNDILITDRVAIACMYLPDVKLHDYLEDQSISLTERGNLDGLLLTGLSLEGMGLLQRYVDLTSDVQTACLVALQGMPCLELAADLRVQSWLDAYRSLLDNWKLWHQRADFDVYRASIGNTPRHQQVYISCNYCGKSVSCGSAASTRGRPYMLGAPPTLKTKVTSCPACRKPLPRCALCLINMGTPSAPPGNVAKTNKAIEEGHKVSNFSDWFTWCQSCRHGGHASHLAEWFRSHSECPVTGCHCKCINCDTMSQLVTEPQTKYTTHGHT